MKILSLILTCALWFPSAGHASDPPWRKNPYTRDDIESTRLMVVHMFAFGQVDELEQMHQEFLALQRARGPGRFMMSSFVKMADLSGQDPAKELEVLERWKRERPKSALRPIFESAVYESRAWKHRGGGYASTVAPEAMTLYEANLERAMVALQKAGPEARSTPLYYSQAISIAGASGRPPQVLDAIFEEGVARFPIDWRIYRERLHYLLPQWDGSLEKMERFIRDAARRTEASERKGMYARLWYSIIPNLRGVRDFYRDTGVKWPELRDAFEDALALEDYAPFREAYATFACMAKDTQTLRRQAKMLGPEAHFSAARNFVSPDACAEMARSD